MHLSHLLLEEYRLYHHLDLSLSPSGLALHGANASGKSTLLEAVAMLATTRSARASVERDLINWQSGRATGLPPFARAKARAHRADDEVDVEIALQLDGNGGGGGMQKAIRLNGRNVRAMDAVGAIKTVLFAPEDVGLVTGPPAGRRRYLDLMISQIDGRYLRALARYNRILEQRNSLLKSFGRDGVNPASPAVSAQLAFWDEELVAFGARVTARRQLAVRALAKRAGDRFDLFGTEQRLSLSYQPSIDDPASRASGANDPIERLQAVVARSFTELLESSRRDELRRGMSLVGPHRDDFAMTIDEIDVATFGSRGQQRLAVIALKLAETDVMLDESGERPIVLLDDVLSELDPKRQNDLTAAITGMNAQVLITSADELTIERSPLCILPRAEAERGVIRSLSSSAPS